MSFESSEKTSNLFLVVEKTIEPSELAPTVVTYSIESACDEAVAFRIVDDLPDDISPEDVGFHRDHKREHWTVHENSQVAYSDTIPPDETLTAFYYLPTERGDSVQNTRPRIEKATPMETAAVAAGPPTWRGGGAADAAQPSLVDGPLPTVVRGTDSDGPTGRTGDTESVSRIRSETDTPGDQSTTSADLHQTEPEDASETFAKLQEEYGKEEYADFGDDVERAYPDEVDFKELLIGDSETELPSEPAREGHGEDPSAGCEADEEDAPGSEGFEFEPPAAAEASPDERSVLARLLEELEGSELATEEQTLLRERLGLAAPHHMEVKMQHLQSQVADLTAYIDALESFLDDEGTAREILGAFDEDLESVQTRLDRLETTANDTDDRQIALADRLETVEETIPAVPQLRSDVDQLSDASADLTDRLDAAEENIGRVDRRVDSRIEPLEDAVDRHRDDITALQAAVDTLRDRYETIGTALRSAARAFRTVPETTSDD